MKISFFADRQRAFVFVIKYAPVANARAAVVAIEFVAMENLVPALGALNGSIDQLEHRRSRFSQPHKN
jgi:hypothetical protein